MKSTSTILLLVAAAAAVVSPTQGREAMLGDEDKGQRRLNTRKLFDQDYYNSLYARCCDPEEGDFNGTQAVGWDDCSCPVRSGEKSGQKSWFDCIIYGKEDAQTYAQKWNDQCAEGGWIYKKAIPSN
jgi:hypothetical protein